MNGFAVVVSTDVDKPVFFGTHEECLKEMPKMGLVWNWLKENNLEVRHLLLRKAKKNPELYLIMARHLGQSAVEYEMGEFISYPR